MPDPPSPERRAARPSPFPGPPPERGSYHPSGQRQTSRPPRPPGTAFYPPPAPWRRAVRPAPSSRLLPPSAPVPPGAAGRDSCRKARPSGQRQTSRLPSPPGTASYPPPAPRRRAARPYPSPWPPPPSAPAPPGAAGRDSCQRAHTPGRRRSPDRRCTGRVSPPSWSR